MNTNVTAELSGQTAAPGWLVGWLADGRCFFVSFLSPTFYVLLVPYRKHRKKIETKTGERVLVKASRNK